MSAPKVYAFCNTPPSPGCRWYDCIAIAEDGTHLASHICSHPSYGPHDLGVTSDWKHESYRAHYPDGFSVVWVEYDDPELAAAMALNAKMGEGVSA